jgi:hypothetical protein
MHKKLIIFIISMLLISPVFATGQRLLNFNIAPTNYSDDVPNWQDGNIWRYDVSYEGDLGETMTYSLNFENLEFTANDAGGTFTMDISGDVTGSLTLFEIQLVSGSLQDTEITGTATVDKSNNGLTAIDAHIDGKIAVAGIPVKTFTMDIDVTIDPPYNAVGFPISVGKKWTIPISDIDGTVDVSLLDNPIIISDIVGGDSAECTSIESVSTAAGSFDAYKIITNGDVEEFYYAPDAGNVIKAHGDISNLVDVELLHTTFGLTPGAPNKPSKPQGPSSGTPGSTYTYSSSTTDDEGDQIYYLFSWGDGSDSGWKGPFPSGTPCEASKKWNIQGTYPVKVKAKDTENHESRWSDTLSVSMPKPKDISNSFLQKLFDRHPAILNLLRYILD